MIKTFADKQTRDIYLYGKSGGLAPNLVRRVLRKLEYIDLATSLDDLRVLLATDFIS